MCLIRCLAGLLFEPPRGKPCAPPLGLVLVAVPVNLFGLWLLWPSLLAAAPEWAPVRLTVWLWRFL